MVVLLPHIPLYVISKDIQNQMGPMCKAISKQISTELIMIIFRLAEITTPILELPEAEPGIILLGHTTTAPAGQFTLAREEDSTITIVMAIEHMFRRGGSLI